MDLRCASSLTCHVSPRHALPMYKPWQHPTRSLRPGFVAAEIEFLDQWAAINALDLGRDIATGDVMGLQAKANGAFARSIDALRAARSK